MAVVICVATERLAITVIIDFFIMLLTIDFGGEFCDMFFFSHLGRDG